MSLCVLVDWNFDAPFSIKWYWNFDAQPHMFYKIRIWMIPSMGYLCWLDKITQ